MRVRTIAIAASALAIAATPAYGASSHALRSVPKPKVVAKPSFSPAPGPAMRPSAVWMPSVRGGIKWISVGRTRPAVWIR